MRQFILGLSIGVAFAAGCAAGQVTVPHAVAQIDSTKQYFCFEGARAVDVMGNANKAGSDGWELRAAANFGSISIWCFQK